jgi:hypothetical protein
MRLFFSLGLAAVSGVLFSRPALAQGDPTAIDYPDPAATPQKPGPAAGREIPASAGTSRVEGLQRQWYGLPLAIADLGAIGTTAAGFGIWVSDPSLSHLPGWPVLFTGLGAYALDGMIVHAANGEIGKGFGSLGMRVGMPALAGVTGVFVAGLGLAAAGGCHSQHVAPEDYCALDYLGWGFFIGVGAGMVAASVIDNTLLAYKNPADKPPAEPGRPTVSLAPVVDPRRGVAGLGLNGTW